MGGGSHGAVGDSARATCRPTNARPRLGVPTKQCAQAPAGQRHAPSVAWRCGATQVGCLPPAGAGQAQGVRVGLSERKCGVSVAPVAIKSARKSAGKAATTDEIAACQKLQCTLRSSCSVHSPIQLRLNLPRHSARCQAAGPEAGGAVRGRRSRPRTRVTCVLAAPPPRATWAATSELQPRLVCRG